MGTPFLKAKIVFLHLKMFKKIACGALLKKSPEKFKYLASKSEREVGGGGGSDDWSEHTLTYVLPNYDDRLFCTDW